MQRSIQGRMQAYGDQVGDQYVVADTNGDESYRSEVSSTEITAPGWGHPTTITTADGSYRADKRRELRIWE